MQRLRYDDITMRYPSEDGAGTLALDGLSFSVEKGESVAIIGPSGCGKSSTLQMAAGLLQPTSGSVTIDGVPVTAPRQNTSLILQDFGLLPWKTVRDNAELGLKIHGVGKAERRQRAERALGLVGLQDFAQAYPSGLSGGMRQRLALARSLALDVDLLLMDEPLSALDALLREQLQDTLLALWQAQGYAQILVTHSIEEAVFLGQRILVLTPRPGRVIAVVDNPDVGSDDYRGSDAFFERCTDIRKKLRAAVEATKEASHA